MYRRFFVIAIAALAIGCTPKTKSKKPKDHKPPPTGGHKSASTGQKTPKRGASSVAGKTGDAIKRTPPASFAKAAEFAPWTSVDDVKKACAKHLAAALEIKKGLLAVKTFDQKSVLEPYNNLLIELDRIMPMSELIANVHPKKPVREAAEKCEQQAKKLVTALKLDRGLYGVLRKVDPAGLDASTKRFIKHLLREYKRAGVDRDDKTRAKLATLDAKMVKLGQEFSRNIRNDKRFIDITEKQLAGLPKDFIETRKKKAKGGKIRISTDYPDFYPVVSYADDESVRKGIYQQFLSRAFPKNQAVLQALLQARHDYATTLGYADWASYNAEDKMVKKKGVIADFLKRVVALARPRMESDKKDVLARKKKDFPKATAVYYWDRFYYVNKIRKERFGVDPAAVRAHFEFGRVKAGIMALSQKLFAVTFKKVDAKVWHPSVDAYDVYDRGKRIARFYLDLHPRKGKYGHAAEFPIITGIPGVQLPAASLVTNFPAPKKGGPPALMEHHQVTTFFHEFGHLMHQLLAGRHHWVTQSGINCEWDFVEAPSQLLEEWTWDHAVLAKFAKHHKTGNVIPKALVDKMRKAKEFGRGLHVMRQMFYAYLSFTYHSQDPKTLDLVATMKRLYQDISPYPHQGKSAVFANFGHLNGYSSMYYTYMWSLVMAKDLFTRFAKEGLMSEKTALSYRQTVLEPGGAKDAAVMMKDFLGRPYSFAAFQTWLKGS
jgi:thimet oligopeptidase